MYKTLQSNKDQKGQNRKFKKEMFALIEMWVE